jgi:hypothetical protein
VPGAESVSVGALSTHIIEEMVRGEQLLRRMRLPELLPSQGLTGVLISPRMRAKLQLTVTRTETSGSLLGLFGEESSTQGFLNVTRLAASGYACVVRLVRKETRDIPAPLEPCAAELRQIVSEAQQRAEATVLRTAEKLNTQFGASSQGLVKGFHDTHEEAMAWRRPQLSGPTDLRYTKKEKFR